MSRTFSVDELPAIARAWDAAVDRTPGADVFCASSLWSFAAALCFPVAAPPIVVGDGRAFCGLRATATDNGGTALVGLDPLWGFATPCVGHPQRAAAMTSQRLHAEDHAVAAIAGQRRDSALTAALVGALEPTHQLFVGPTEHRLRADLRDGVAGWMSRRSARFRQRIRRLERDAAAVGLDVEDMSAAPPDDVINRLLAIDVSTWKGREATGLSSPELADFYRVMAPGLASRDQLRVLIARCGHIDVGYIFGGIRGDTYRGLQIGYRENAPIGGVGHWLQVRQIERLVEEGIATYDLGMDMDYKRRWIDEVDESFTLLAVPR